MPRAFFPGATRALDLVPQGIGLVGLVAATVVLWGHALDVATLVRPFADLAPVRTDTAVCFALGSFSLLGIARRWRLAPWTAFALLLIGCAIFAQSLTGRALGIRTLLSLSAFHADADAAAHMAPYAAAGFVLLGTALVTFALHMFLGTALAVLGTALGGVAILGDAAGLGDALAWERWDPMSAHTAVGLLVLGSGLVLLGYVREGRDLQPGLWLTALLMGALVGVAGLVAWQGLARLEHKRVVDTTRTTARGVAEEVRRRVRQPALALETLARRGHERGWSSPADWALDAKLVGSLPGFEAIEWIDASFAAQLLASGEGSTRRLATNVDGEALRRRALAWVRTHDASATVGPLPFSDGGTALLVFTPVRIEGVETYFGATVAADALFAGLADALAPGSGVRIRYGGRTVHRRDHGGAFEDRAQTAAVRLVGPERWEVVVAPGPEIVAAASPALPEAVLAAAAVIGLLLALALRSAGIAALRASRFQRAVEERTADLEETSVALRFENAERRRSEQALLRVGAVSRLLSGELDRDRLVQAVTDAGTELTGAAYGAYFRHAQDASGGRWHLHSLSGARPEAFERLPVPRDTELFGPTLRGEAVMRIADVTQDHRYGHNPPHAGLPEGHPPVKSYLAVPVVTAAGKVRGGLFFGHPEPDRFGEREERIALTLAAQVAIGLDNAALYESERQARAAAERANNLKDRFIATLGHELRNPLASLRNALAILEDRPDAEIGIRMRGILSRQISHLTRLVEDLLDESQIADGRLDVRLEAVDLVELVQANVETERGRIEASGLRLKTSLPATPIWSHADPVRISQVFQNLVGNAVKFTPRGGELGISLSLEEDGKRALLCIRDDGPGLEPDQLETIFQPYVRSGDRRDRAGGLGLGLAIARALVTSHGGTLEAHSEGRDRGTEFRVRLRVHEAVRVEPPTPPVADARLPSGGRHRVLIVDDHRDSADSLATLLERRGHQVEVAYTGEDGVAAVERFAPEVVLCDIGLPDLDGYEVAARVRSDGALRLIALTGYADVDVVRRMRDAGFAGHLSKPVDLRRLERMLGSDGYPPTRGAC